jgi:formylglycine-generating enzyme required for sulfatase activity
MVGNVWEWTSDWYSFEGMPKEYKKKFKVIRGGVLSVHLRSDYSYTFDRNYMPSDSKFNFIGFRGAKSIKSQ